MAIDPCCPEFANIVESIDQASDGTYSVKGCCGNGCYVLDSCFFCPFCGANIAEEYYG